MSDLKAGAGFSTVGDPDAAVRAAIDAARASLGGAAPGLAIVTSTVEHDAARIDRALRQALPGVPLHGATTSLGALGTKGVASGREGAIGVLLLASEGASRFAAAGVPLGADVRASARRAAELLAERGGSGAPRVLLVAGSPGTEEDQLAGIADVFPDVPVFGGSAADHAIEGAWRVFTDEGAVASGISLAGVWGDARVGAAIEAPYAPTDKLARVTAAQGRSIGSLDGRPASAVLGEWVGDAVAEQAREGGNILVQTSLTPLGIARQGSDGDFYTLLHPAQMHTNGTVDVFAKAHEGETVCLMRGSEESLVSVVDRLATRALASGGMRHGEVRAGLLIYCAGCAGAVGPGIERALGRLRAALGDVALIGRCTFGEQGHVRGVGNVHTNLSVALVLFG